MAGRVRAAVVLAVAPHSTIPSELSPGHPYLKSLPDVRRYIALRTRESGRSIQDGNRVVSMHMALDMVRDLPGEYAELGTFRGVVASVIWKRKSPGAIFHVFDTFEGFDERDLQDNRLDTTNEKAAFANTSLDLALQRIAGGPHPELVPHVGFFPDTFVGLDDRKFKFVHVDLDLAEPITAALERFWPRMTPGGVILIHDCMSARYPMACEAVEAFFKPRGISIWTWNDRLGTAMVICQPGMGA
jgi:O-methyltransferase